MRSRGRSDRGGVEGVEDQVRAGQVAGRVGLVAPEHHAVRARHHQRALGEAAGVQDAERAARRALGLEVRELLDRHAELVAERLLGPDGVAGDAVERRAALLEVLEDLLVDAQLVRADRRERERVEDEDGDPAQQVLPGEAVPLVGRERELGRRLPGLDDGAIASGAGRARG